MVLLAEDQVLPNAGATPNAGVGTGGQTVWLMATVVLKAGTVNGASALLAGTASGGAASTLSSLTAHVTHRPLIRGTTGARVQHRGRVHVVRCSRRAAARRSRACASLRRAARITAAARAEFIYSALLRHLPKSLFCYHGRALRTGAGWTAWFRPAGPARGSASRPAA